MIDLASSYTVSFDKKSIRVFQDGYKEQSFTREQLQATLATDEIDFRRALALQEALDILDNENQGQSQPTGQLLCVCLELIHDNGPCPVHG